MGSPMNIHFCGKHFKNPIAYSITTETCQLPTLASHSFIHSAIFEWQKLYLLVAWAGTISFNFSWKCHWWCWHARSSRKDTIKWYAKKGGPETNCFWLIVRATFVVVENAHRWIPPFVRPWKSTRSKLHANNEGDSIAFAVCKAVPPPPPPTTTILISISLHFWMLFVFECGRVC